MVSVRSAGSSSHSRASLVIAGASNSTEAAEVKRGARGPGSATTSRSTPSSCTRSSSTEANRSAGSGRTGLGDQPVERVVLGEHRGLRHRRQAGHVLGLVAAELGDQHDQRAADGVDVRGDGGADGRHLRRLVADRAVDRRLLVVDPADAAEVDQLDRVADLDQVVRLEVAVDQAQVVQVAEKAGRTSRMYASAWSTGSGSKPAVVGPHPVLQDLLQRGAADVLHHDVAGLVVGDEVVDLHDQRVLDLGQELPLDDGHRERVLVAGVQQTLEHHPAVGDVPVLGQVDPAEAAVGQAAGHLVLVGHQVARASASG